MINRQQIEDFLLDQNPQTIEKIVRQANSITQQYFGRTISLYAPVYVSNYCSSHCTYCGFSTHNRIKRIKLQTPEIDKEMEYISRMGIENILILTGESYITTPLPYLKEAVYIAKKYFPSISLEVHPMETDEYRELFLAGVDGVTIYQETYNRNRYGRIHLSGKKKDYDYRYATPERIAKSGIRQISMGILLGLVDDVASDIDALYQHLRFMERNYPGVEYSLSFPRLRPIKKMGFEPSPVSDLTLMKIIALTRICFPRVGINFSTREKAQLRNLALEFGVTRISAASKTSVGGYTSGSCEDLIPQFDIQDERTLEEILHTLKERNFDPVLTDWRRIDNESI